MYDIAGASLPEMSVEFRRPPSDVDGCNSRAAGHQLDAALRSGSVHHLSPAQKCGVLVSGFSNRVKLSGAAGALQWHDPSSRSFA